MSTQGENNVISDFEISIIVATVPEIISGYIYIQQNYCTLGCPAWMKAYMYVMGFGLKCKIYDQNCKEIEKGFTEMEFNITQST